MLKQLLFFSVVSGLLSKFHNITVGGRLACADGSKYLKGSVQLWEEDGGPEHRLDPDDHLASADVDINLFQYKCSLAHYKCVCPECFEINAEENENAIEPYLVIYHCCGLHGEEVEKLREKEQACPKRQVIRLFDMKHGGEKDLGNILLES